MKSYSIDVLLAATAAYAVVATERWSFTRRCLWGALVAPPLIWLSFPAAFIFGGVLLALLPGVRSTGWNGRAAYLAFGLSVCGAFLALALGPVKAQRTAAMDDCWVGAFPDWSQPLWVPVWAVANTFEVFRYCYMPFGQPLLIPACIGVWAIGRGSSGLSRLLVLVGPIALAFVASLLGKYPYAAARVIVFACPALCVLVAAGLAVLVDRFHRVRGWRWALVFWLICCLVPVGFGVRTVVWPWSRAACDEASLFVLDTRGPTDPIYANHWEYEYYFRRMEPDLVRVDHSSVQGPKWDEWVQSYAARPLRERPRIWVIFTQAPLPSSFPYELPAAYRVENQFEFQSTRVYEVRPTLEVGK